MPHKCVFNRLKSQVPGPATDKPNPIGWDKSSVAARLPESAKLQGTHGFDPKAQLHVPPLRDNDLPVGRFFVWRVTWQTSCVW